MFQLTWNPLKKGAERKRLERQKATAEKQIENIASYEQFWEHNRTILSESELSDLRTKDQRTRDLWNWLDLVLEGSDINRDPDWPTMESGIAAVEAHVTENGTCNPEIALIPE